MANSSTTIFFLLFCSLLRKYFYNVFSHMFLLPHAHAHQSFASVMWVQFSLVPVTIPNYKVFNLFVVSSIILLSETQLHMHNPFISIESMFAARFFSNTVKACWTLSQSHSVIGCNWYFQFIQRDFVRILTTCFTMHFIISLHKTYFQIIILSTVHLRWHT